jgi:hypothetical protein
LINKWYSCHDNPRFLNTQFNLLIMQYKLRVMLSPSIHKFGDEFNHSELSAE